MKLFLSSLVLTVFFGIWMVVTASSHLASLDRESTIETVSGAYSNPVNRTLKQDSLLRGKSGSKKLMAEKKDAVCSVGGFDRACKPQIAGLKVSPPLFSL